MSGALTAQRRAVQADRRIAGALLRGAAGSRAMAGARARHQATAARDGAAYCDEIGNHLGAVHWRAQAERLDRAALILGATE